MDYTLPTILMIVLAISHTAAIQFLKKKRETLDLSTPEGAAKAKNFGFIILMLYVEIPVITAIIWLVVAPALAPTAN